MKFTDTKIFESFKDQQPHETKQEIEMLYNFIDKINKDETVINRVLEILHSTYDTKEIIALFVHCLIQQHRTHQQSIIGKIYHILKEYGKNDTDLRNECAVKWAKEATEKEAYFPFL
jgi:hypothetical protein